MSKLVLTFYELVSFEKKNQSNAPHVDLWNGDVGVFTTLAPDALGDRSGELRAAFPAPRHALGSASPGVRSIAPSQLPQHNLVYATTVHKSQGSEFEEVALLIPDSGSPVLTRELIYTAGTRARRRVVIHGTREAIAAAIDQPIRRASGLQEAVWGHEPLDAP